MKLSPSIFNDVIGPVMRGPSSSHSAAALRIGRICRDLMERDINEVLVQFDMYDALATTHLSQGSDMGIMGGLMGFETDDERLMDVKSYLEQSGIRLQIEVIDTKKQISNLYQLTLRNSREERVVRAVSTGGGMMEVQSIDGTKVSLSGDTFVTIIFTGGKTVSQILLKGAPSGAQITVFDSSEPFVEVKSMDPPEEDWIGKLNADPDVSSVRILNPMLPILSGSEIKVPFTNCDQMMQFGENKHLSLWELSAVYESARGNITTDQVLQMARQVYEVMRNSINTGLQGTHFNDRILGAQSQKYKKKLEQDGLAGGESLHNIILYVSAIMEVKSSMGTIVAAPTAGSCGTFPGALLGVADSVGSEEEEMIKAMLGGSLIGLFIASQSTFSAEIGGCQAECGSGAGMAAAGLVSLMGGSVQQSVAAASLALQNSLGMICDPIAARVEAPCLGKNISSATNALACANMAMAGYDHLIPLDEVIETMDSVGRSMPGELRCTALGGLSITKTSKSIEKSLRDDGALDETKSLT